MLGSSLSPHYQLMDIHDNRFHQLVLDNLFDGVYFVDPERQILYWNKGAERITGFLAKDIIGKRCYDDILQHVNEAGTSLCKSVCPLVHCMQDGQPRQAQVYLHHKNGHRVAVLIRATPVRDEQGKIIGAVEIFSDNLSLFPVVKHLHRLQTEALTDPLTNIGNRRFLDVKLESALHKFHQYHISCGIIFLDLDHFKQVNDTWGHEIGDRVLQMVARTLQKNTRRNDFVGRWGGEEFLLILFDLDKKHLYHIAQKLRVLIAHSELPLPNGKLRVTASFGATMMRAEDTLETLLERVDALLYQSKQTGRNRVTVG